MRGRLTRRNRLVFLIKLIPQHGQKFGVYKMAKIPRAVSTQELTTRTTGPQLDPSAFTGETRAIERLGGIFAQVGESLQKVKDFRQSTQAKVNSTRALNQ